MRLFRLTRRLVSLGGLTCMGVLMFANPVSAYTPPETDPRIVVTTQEGQILIALAPENAPEHVRQFLAALAAGDFNGANVARLAPKFSVQIVGRLGTARLSGQPVEHVKVGNLRGALSVFDSGKSGDPPTIMFVLASSPLLDADYTSIGFVEAGGGVLQEIANSGTIGDQQPATPIVVTEMHVASSKERALLRQADVTAADEDGTSQLAAIFVVACAAFVAALISAFHDRLGKQRATSLSLLVALLTFFAVWVALGGTEAGSGLVGVALFGGAIAIFKLMGRFERPMPKGDLGGVAQPRQLADGELHTEVRFDQPQGDDQVVLGERHATAGRQGGARG